MLPKWVAGYGWRESCTELCPVDPDVKVEEYISFTGGIVVGMIQKSSVIQK